MSDKSFLSYALSCKCPKCHEGDLYKKGITVDLRDKCDVCGLDFTKNDSADGPAVFMIFVLGFLLVPLALIFEAVFGPPLWVHAVLWSVVALGLTLGALRPLKSLVIALQFKHRPGDWS
jgi:uncharacterized protein (DUF983 family)